MEEPPSPDQGNGAHQPAMIVPPEVMQSLPPQLVDQLRAQGMSVPVETPEGNPGGAALLIQASAHQGPIPPASELRELEQLHPGITTSWFKMVESDAASQVRYRDGETDSAGKLTDASIARNRDGQWLAAALSVLAMVGAIVLFVMGVPWGAFLLSVPVAQLIQGVRPRPHRNPRSGEDPPKN